MRNAVYMAQFKRDLKKIKKRGCDMEKLKLCMQFLIEESELPTDWKDHPLIGNYKNYREMHIEPDWLLVYRIIDDDCIFYRTDTHSDLFSK